MTGARTRSRPLLQVAINGSRAPAEHPAIPRAPGEVAEAALAAVHAGADVVHLHAYDGAGAETLVAGDCAAALRAVRAACPGVPLSLTTSAAIEPDPRRRLELVAAWTELPDRHVPRERARRHVALRAAAGRFTPSIGHGGIAKIVLGSMLGLAALTVLSLLWLPLRARRRRAFGPKAGATLRSLYAIVVGAGGWLLGVLIVLTTMPGVPLDDELLALLSVGVPVGLSVYWGWVHPDWSANSKSLGFALVIAGAFAGAWLGFHATTCSRS